MMKCYDFSATVIAKVDGWVWADNEREAKRLISNNECEVDDVRIRQAFNTKIKQDKKCIGESNA